MRAPLIRKLFEEYATGNYTLGEMVKRTKEWGLRNSRGNQGHLCLSHIHYILTNPFYHGVMHYQKGNLYYPHIYPPIISKELFDQCTTVLKGWNKKPFKWGEKDYIFRGVVTCANTGKVVSAETKRRKRADGSEYEVIYLGTWDPENFDRKVYVNEEILLKEVEEVFKSMQLEPETLAKVIEYIKSSAEGERDYYKTRVLELNKELTGIKSKLDKLMDFFLEDKITEAEHDDKRGQLVMRRDNVMRELEGHNHADDSFNERMIDVLQIAANAHKKFLLSTTGEKRKLIKLVFSTVKLNGYKLDFTLRPPFDAFVKTAKNREWRALMYDFRTFNQRLIGLFFE